VPDSAETHTIYSDQAVSAGSGRAGSPAAPFSKTPAWAGFPEYDLPPAEFISLPLSLPDSPVCNLALPILIQTSLSLFASSRVQTCRCHRPQPESPDRARANLKCLPPLPISADVRESFKSQKKDDAERHRLNGFW